MDVLGKNRLFRKSQASLNAMRDTRKCCCRVDTLFFPFEQKSGHPAIEEIKYVAPAHLKPAIGLDA